MAGENPYTRGSLARSSTTAGTGGGSSLNNNPYSIAQAGVSAMGGAMGLIQDIGGVIDDEKNINTDITQSAYNGIDMPTYQLGDEIKKLQGLKTTQEDVGKGLIGRSTGQGALAGLSMGAAVGSMFPGPGTVIGAGVGAVAGGITGLVTGWLGKENAKNLREGTIGDFGNRIATSRDSFNEDLADYGELQQGRSIFNRLRERKQNRIYNIPSFNSIYS